MEEVTAAARVVGERAAVVAAMVVETAVVVKVEAVKGAGSSPIYARRRDSPARWVHTRAVASATPTLLTRSEAQ